MKKPSKKTLHRLSRIPNVESDRRIANKFNTKTVKEHNGDYTPHKQHFVRKVRIEDIHCILKSEKTNLYMSNTTVLKMSGYKPAESSKAKKLYKKLQNRTLAHPQQFGIYTGEHNCKKRREYARREIYLLKNAA